MFQENSIITGAVPITGNDAMKIPGTHPLRQQKLELSTHDDHPARRLHLTPLKKITVAHKFMRGFSFSPIWIVSIGPNSDLYTHN